MVHSNKLLLDCELKAQEIGDLKRFIRLYKRRIQQLLLLVHARVSAIRKDFEGASESDKRYLFSLSKRKQLGARSARDVKFWGRLFELPAKKRKPGRPRKQS
jgi:hypothetical protein